MLVVPQTVGSLVSALQSVSVSYGAHRSRSLAPAASWGLLCRRYMEWSALLNRGFSASEIALNHRNSRWGTLGLPRPSTWIRGSLSRNPTHEWINEIRAGRRWGGEETWGLPAHRSFSILLNGANRALTFCKLLRHRPW